MGQISSWDIASPLPACKMSEASRSGRAQRAKTRHGEHRRRCLRQQSAGSRDSGDQAEADNEYFISSLLGKTREQAQTITQLHGQTAQIQVMVAKEAEGYNAKMDAIKCEKDGMSRKVD